MIAKVYLTWVRDGLANDTFESLPLNLLAPTMILCFNSKMGLRVTRIKSITIVFEIPNQTLKGHCLKIIGNKTKRKPRGWIRITPT